MKAFFKLTAWTALTLAALGALLGVLLALGVHQGWFGASEVNWVIAGKPLIPSQMTPGEVALLACALALALGLTCLILGLILPIGLIVAAGGVALALLIALPFIGLALVWGAVPYLIVALLVWWMWKLPHPMAQAPAPSQPPQ